MWTPRSGPAHSEHGWATPSQRRGAIHVARRAGGDPSRSGPRGQSAWNTTDMRCDGCTAVSHSQTNALRMSMCGQKSHAQFTWKGRDKCGNIGKKGADSRFPPEAMGWKLWRLDNWPEQKRIRAPVSERAIRELECSAEWSCDNIGIARLQTK